MQGIRVPVHRLEVFLIARVDAHVQLGERRELAQRVGELRVRHEERRDLARVQELHKLGNVRVHDRLPDERQRAVADLHRHIYTIQ